MTRIFMNDGTPLSEYCQENGVHYATILKRMKRKNLSADEAICFVKEKKSKEEVLEKCRKRSRLNSGYSEEEASLPDTEFKKLASIKNSKRLIGKETLGNFCSERGLKYNTVFQFLKRNPDATPEEVDLFYKTQKKLKQEAATEKFFKAIEKNEKFEEVKKLENFSYEQIEEAFKFFNLPPSIVNKIVEDDDFYKYLIESFVYKSGEESESRGRYAFIDHLAEYVQLIKGE